MKSLYYTKENLEIVENLPKEIKSIKSQISKLKSKQSVKPEHKIFFIFDIIFFILIFLFIFYSIKELFLCLFTSRSLFKFLLKFIFIFIMFIFIYVKRLSISEKIHKDDPIQNLLTKDDEIKLNDLEKKLIFLEDKLKIANDNLSNSDIPYKYRNTDALDFFIESFENKRADTLKELINLYEDYLFSIENRVLQEKHYKNIRRDLKDLKREIRWK